MRLSNWPMRIICSHGYVNNLVTWYKSHDTIHDLFDFFRFKYTKQEKLLTLTSLVCKPLQQPLIMFRILRRKATHRLAFCWQFKFSIEEVCLIFSPATNHRLADSVFSGDFRVVFDGFGFCDNFKFEREVVRRTTSFWHDDGLTLMNDCEHGIVWERFLNSDCLLNAVH